MVFRLEDAHFLLDSACLNCTTSAAPRRPHIGCTCPFKRHGTKVWYQSGDRRPGGILRSRTAQVLPRRMTAILRSHLMLNKPTLPPHSSARRAGFGDSCLVVLPIRVVAFTAVAGEIDGERAAVVGVEGDLGLVTNLTRDLLGTLEVDAGQGTHARLGIIHIGEVKWYASVQHKGAAGAELL
ncbi:hypothetical protein THAOC_14550, partial [Thalassiosira oceanica]